MRSDTPYFIEKSLAFSDIHKASGYNIRNAYEVTVVHIQGSDDNDKTVLSKMLAGAKNDRAYVAYSEAVDKYLAGGYRREASFM